MTCRVPAGRPWSESRRGGNIRAWPRLLTARMLARAARAAAARARRREARPAGRRSQLHMPARSPRRPRPLGIPSLPDPWRQALSPARARISTRRDAAAAHAPRVPRSTSSTSRGGPSAQGSARRARAAARAPLRRAPLGGGAARAEHERAQAGGAAGAVLEPARARQDRAEPGRPRLHAAPRLAPAAGAERAAKRRACSTRSPAAAARCSCATARCSSSPTRAACARRSWSRCAMIDVDYDGEQLRVEGKGRKTRFVPVGEPAMAALRDYLERARGALAGEPGAPRREQGAAGALFLVEDGPPAGTSDVRRRLRGGRRARGRWRSGPAERSHRTRCVTASRPTCSTAAPTCAASRSCSGTRACRAPRFTLG